MAYFNFDNKRVWYKLIGRGKPVLFLSGNTVSSKIFNPLTKYYKKQFMMILLDVPGYGKSRQDGELNADFWYYNSLCCAALLDHLQLKKVRVIGTGGGALTAINFALEFPEKAAYIVADSFEGEYPLAWYMNRIEADRETDKKRLSTRLFWYIHHGSKWRDVVDADTRMQLNFFKSGKSFFHKSLSSLRVPTLFTGSKKDFFIKDIENVYKDMKAKSGHIEVILFGQGMNPAILSNRLKFSKIIADRFR